MSSRLRFVVAYDGAPFAGWQSQKNGNTIQDYLERAFGMVAQHPVRVHGAGRTDAGVHALEQSAHADLPAPTLTPHQWVSALNASLPPTIRVMRAQYASAAFHARFNAKGKIYRYRIWNDNIMPPFEQGRAWHIPAPLDLEAMVAEAGAFVGTHDFASFAANRGKPGEETVRTIDSVRLRRAGKCVALEFSGDGFLYKMVRLMVGALVRRGHGKAAAGEIALRLGAPAITPATARLVAPAGGLFLVRVRY
jgi:tRNA pseudouridine38-40 synthase